MGDWRISAINILNFNSDLVSVICVGIHGFFCFSFYKRERERENVLICWVKAEAGVMHACNAAGGKLLTRASGVNRALRIHAGFSEAR